MTRRQDELNEAEIKGHMRIIDDLKKILFKETRVRLIFVFGSNLAGHHGKGAAWDAAVHHGALHGVGVGMSGNAYAIPTKDCALQVLPLGTIRRYVEQFEEFASVVLAAQLPWTFQVTRIGCGLAGYKDEVMAPMFQGCSPNCEFDDAWSKWLPGKLFWGTWPDRRIRVG